LKRKLTGYSWQVIFITYVQWDPSMGGGLARLLMCPPGRMGLTLQVRLWLQLEGRRRMLVVRQPGRLLML
jgi:hypothetical protein